MPNKLSILVFVTVVLSSAAAVASPSIAMSGESERPGDRRTEVNVAFLLGGNDIGGRRRFSRGFQADVGRRFGDLVVLGEYDYLSVGQDEAAGSLSRLGVTARYSLLRTRSDGDHRRPGPVSGDFWLEGGVGAERIAWNEGGILTRPDVVMGVGWQFNGVMDRRSDRPRYYGPYVAFRTTVARAPKDPDAMAPTCGGPCDHETRPSRNDIGLYFHFGINWGR